MSRIRTLKPEHRSHRKVGRFSDRTYRLWVSMILEADDHGRLVCDAGQLRALTWPYERVTDAQAERAIQEVARCGVVRLYVVDGVRYAEFVSWKDHQRISHPSNSRIPPWNHVSGILQNPPESSTGKGKEGKGSRITATASSSPDGPPAEAGDGGSGSNGASAKGTPEADAWARAPWGSPEALAALYNAEGPDNIPAVETLSSKRRERASRLLREFPSKDWWLEVFREYNRSNFLRGRTKPGDGHAHFRPDFDWLLATNRAGVENAVRVHDGVFR